MSADLSGGIFTAQLSGLLVGNQNSGTSASNVTASMIIGTSAANHLDISGPSAGPVGNAGVVVVGRQQDATATGPTVNSNNIGIAAVGTLTIGNLDATSNVTATDNGTAILVGGAQTGGAAIGTLNLNGGSLTLTTNGAGISGGLGTSTVNFNGMTLIAGASSTGWIQSLTNAKVQAGGANFNSNGFSVAIPQVMSHDAALGASPDGGLTKTGGGTVTLGAVNTYTGPTNVSAGTLVMTKNFLTGSSVTVSGGATMQLAPSGATPNNVVLKTGSVSTAGGKLDLSNNKLVVTTPGSVGTWNGTAYSGVTAQIASGYSGGTWSGNGIVTSQMQAAAPSLLTALAVAAAGDVNKTTFGGVPVSSTDTLVMYTWTGDANLDGKVNADDYFQIDSHYNQSGGPTTSWLNGDFNYDGKINGDDYVLIDAAFAAQGGAVFPAAPTGGLAGVSAVPEPVGLVMVLPAAIG